MGSRTLTLSVFCLAASLAVACGTDDDSGIATGGGPSSGGGSGTGGHSAAAGRNGTAGNSGASGVGGNMPGGDTAGAAGEGGAAGAVGNNGCTQFAPFVQGLIKDSSNERAVPTPVNGVVFCADPQDPAAFNALF